jgi:hypothetical protein
MPRDASHDAILLPGALASSSYQSPQSKGCQGSPLAPPQNSSAPHCFSVSPLAEIRPEAQLASMNLRGEAEKVFLLLLLLFWLCFRVVPSDKDTSHMWLFNFTLFSIQRSQNFSLVSVSHGHLPSAQRAQRAPSHRGSTLFPWAMLFQVVGWAGHIC